VTTIAFNENRIASWPISDLIFLAAAVLVALNLLTGRTANLAPAQSRKTSPLILVGSLVLLTAGTLSSLWSVEPFVSMMEVGRLAWLTLIWFWLIRAVSVDVPALNQLVTAFKVTVMIGAMAAILDFFNLVELSPRADIPSARESGFYGHPNGLAGLLAVGLPLFVLGVPRAMSGAHAQPVWRRLLPCVVILYALSITGSMTGFLSAAVGMVAIGVLLVLTGDKHMFRRLSRNPLAPLVFVALTGAGLVTLLQSDLPVIERFTLLNEGDRAVAGSASARPERNEIVLDRFDKLLVVGVGHDPASGELAWNLGHVGAHNMLVKLIYEAGVPAAMGLLMIIAAVMRQAWRLTLNCRRSPYHSSVIAFFAGFIAINFFAQFQPLITERYYWIMFALVGAMWGLRRQELQRPQEAPASA
jgi:hypothetical protein